MPATTPPLPRLNIPATLVIGGGSSKLIGQECRRQRITRPLVVTDSYMEKTGLLAQVLANLATESINGHPFSKVQPDPTLANVDAGLNILRSFDCDGLIALGGGSPIDAAKAIAVMARNPGTLPDYAGYHKIPHPGLPLIAIPTTAGTGSEVTKVTVITDESRHVKMMILDAHLLPTAALVDYELTLSMPAPLTAAVGIDSLTHALEAYVSKKAHAMTDLLALESGRLITANLRTAFAEPSNRPAREAMMRGATLGGMAFSNASVCLVHGMSRPIGAHFHVAHGLSNAMLLPQITAFSVEAASAKYAAFARHTGLADAPDDATACRQLVSALAALNRDLCVQSPKTYGIPADKYEALLPAMAEEALASGSPGNNPRVPTAGEIITLYRACYDA
jgi:alcohol dehydrogenase class IV